MSQYDADAAGGEPSPASSSMTPNEALARALEEADVPQADVPIQQDDGHWLHVPRHEYLLERLAALGYEVRPIEPTRAGQACADCGQVWPNVDDHNDHPFRPIDSGTAEGYESEAGVPKSRRPSSSASAVPGAQASVRPADQAEAADREAAGARAPDSVPSAAVAPLEPIPTDWGVGPLTRKRGGA